MTLIKFPVVLISSTLFFSCTDEYSGTSMSRPQLIIPKESLRYDSALLLPPYDYKKGVAKNNVLSQPVTAQIDSLAAQTLAQTRINATQPFDTATTFLAKGLNPPHGYPGHRCDLKVGEPLNLKAEIQPPKQNLNPPHGQPGHRCDIAVGAPLSSMPAVSTTQTSVQTSNSMLGPIVVKNGLNPAHGQPGHRCDIAVGAPLDSKSLIVPDTNQNIQTTTNKTDTLDTTQVDN